MVAPLAAATEAPLAVMEAAIPVDLADRVSVLEASVALLVLEVSFDKTNFFSSFVSSLLTFAY